MSQDKLKFKVAAYKTFIGTALSFSAEAFVDETVKAGGLPDTVALRPVYVKGMREVLSELKEFGDDQVLDLMLKLGYLKAKKVED
jgi:hypothetical protein